MIAQVNSRFQSQSPRLRPSGSKRMPWKSGLFIGGMTAVFLLWLVYRLVVQPEWAAHLPGVLGEMLHLAEAAGLVTLGLLWGVVWLRRGGVTAVTIQPLDLEQLYHLSPAEFERYVAGLFRKKGYQVQMRGRSGDLGVDILLTKADGRRAIVQCKRYRNKVGPDVVRELYGTLIHEQADHAFLVTTAEISASARRWAEGKPMTLIDGKELSYIAGVMRNA